MFRVFFDADAIYFPVKRENLPLKLPRFYETEIP